MDMDARQQHLKVLGLGPDAAWDEVTQTYKDLMRVWHPDRFQSDERLRKRAEEQSQKINHAMSELRKLGKEPSKPKPPPQEARQQPAQQHRAQRPQTQTSQSSGASAYSKQSFGFGIAPLLVRQRPLTSLLRLSGAAIIFWLALESMLRSSHDRYQCAFASGLLFYSLDSGIKNLLFLIFTKPLVAVDRKGLFSLRTGRLNWIDFDHVWPSLSTRSGALHIVLSKHYLSKQPFLIRALLYVRSAFKTAHITVSFGGLHGSPIHVVNAMKLQKIHDDIVVEDLPQRATRKLLVTRIVSMLCAIAVCIRCLTQFEITPIDWLPYVGLFAILRTTDCVIRLSRHS